MAEALLLLLAGGMLVMIDCRNCLYYSKPKGGLACAVNPSRLYTGDCPDFEDHLRDVVRTTSHMDGWTAISSNAQWWTSNIVTRDIPSEGYYKAVRL
jgi:hypothetical protein